ncbi:hypothetical protein ACFQY0_15910 [Haloferula chungangensis]|uniref:Uncharacterized protein n=1 Tax=Haloferula chungangensis TaxID=1048331 RepID=A0ABW2LB23_9BACT
MKKSIALLLLTSASVFAGELPELFEKPWTAWYSGYEGKKFHFGVNPDGEASLIPIDNKSKERVSQHGWISIKPVILETSSSGRDIVKKPLEDGWEAITPESNEAEKVSFRGTVTGGAKYEVHIEIDGDEVYCSGQLLDKGELTENPIRFAVRVTVPNSYRHTKDEEELMERVEDDRFEFVMVDKTKAKFKGEVPEDVVAKQCQAIRWAEADISYYKGDKFEFDAGDIGSFEIENPKTNPIAQGFTLVWTPDPAKNAGGKGKLMIQYK